MCDNVFMNILQSGTPSSQLSPQSFKNSSQNSSFQSSADVQQSTQLNQSVNTLQPVAGLQVTDGQNTGVLGVSKQNDLATTTLSEPAVVSSSGSFMPAAFVILFVALALSIFFYNRYRRLQLLPSEES